MRDMLHSLVIGVFLVSAAPAKTFTLEQVLSAPFPYELTAAPGGSKVAWLLNERGARNVWMAAAPDFKGVRLTSYTKDDGQDVGQLCWTPDGKSVIYVRGGDLEFLGRPDPNPAADPAGTDQAIWIAAPGEAPRKIASGHSPVISPKGDRIAYLMGGQIWVIPVAGGSAAPLLNPRSGVTAGEVRWSPDGSKLAYVSDRGNHSFIAVYDFGSKALSYLDPSVDRDANPAWSPDGKQVAFTRMTSGTGGGRGGRRAGDPWSIHVASVADGTGRQVWKSDAGQGSVFRAVAAGDQLVWTGGEPAGISLGARWVDAFVLRPDRGRHGYAADARRVRSGACHVLGGRERDRILVEPGGVRPEGCRPAPHLAGEQCGRTSACRGDERGGFGMVAGAGDGRRGVSARRCEASGAGDGSIGRRAGRELAPETIPADFPTDDLVVPEQVIYTATDGMPVHAQLFLPPGGAAGVKHAALVFMHGGSRRQMLLGWHYMDYYNNAYAMNQYLASQGYVVLSINYRSGIGYGLNFREAINFGASGASEFNDVEGAGLYLRTRADVDAARIGLWGGSYGGYLTALGLARASNLFAAGVDFHGVHDWSARPATAAAISAGGAGADAARTAFESSPMASVRTWRSPVLLIHGDDDRNVNFSETIAMANALRQQGVYFEQLILPDEIHTFLRHASWLRGYHAAVDFFHRKL